MFLGAYRSTCSTGRPRPATQTFHWTIPQPAPGPAFASPGLTRADLGQRLDTALTRWLPFDAILALTRPR